MTLSLLSFCHKIPVNFIFAPTEVAISPRFHAKKNCLSWHEIQSPSDLLRNAPKIASNTSDVLYHRGKNLRSTVPYNEPLKFKNFTLPKTALKLCPQDRQGWNAAN